MTFAELGLDPLLLNALAAKGYASPTAVQTDAIPAALEGHDLLVSSQTGSGKTAAFILPSLQRMLQPAVAAGRGPRVLVLTPTRELALQVLKATEDYGSRMRRVRSAALVGGVPYPLQLRALSQPLDIVVATPGRLLDHLQRGRLDLRRVETLVLDEADRMLSTATFLAWTFGSECVRRDRPIKSPEYRTAFWNVAHGYSGLDRVCAKLKSMDLQAFGLVEADQHYILDLDRWRREFPEYDVVGTDFGGVFAVRGTIVSHQLHDLSSYSFCEEIALRMGNLELMVLLVDIASDLKRPREIPLRNLATLANTFGDRPLIIMGDFNTPDDSCWTAPLRANHHQAFRQRGTGYAATWPLPLPVLTLDQVWTNSQVEVSRCQNLWTFDSDHRPVVTSFSIPN